MTPGRIDYSKYSLCKKCSEKKPKGTYCPDCGAHMRNHVRFTLPNKKKEYIRY